VELRLESGKARELYEKHAAAMAYVVVEDVHGDQEIGSAVHVGEGVFVTARHVVGDRKIIEIASTARQYVPLSGEEAATARAFLGSERHPVHVVDNGKLSLADGPFFHHNDKVDIAVFRVQEIDSRTPAAMLGDHLDDWLGGDDFTLSEAIVLGYPRVPLAQRPVLVGARAEVNATIDRIDNPHVHFILSSMSRGGFSGGLALSEYGRMLGIITSSLVTNHQFVELGFMAALTVEPIYVCLADHKLLPDCQADGWDGFWNEASTYFVARDDASAPDGVVGGRTRASVHVFDDGKTVALTVSCDDEELFVRAIAEATGHLSGQTFVIEEKRPLMQKIHVSGELSSVQKKVGAAAKAVAHVFQGSGLKRMSL
jgi:hypothetical protein